ncbi:MAG: VOC family protein [Paracoccus sp. (in: a-proteobacteria)]|nr:VOC family protein [Paracoccus sp. (in: a-proteobacteria)]
MTHPVKGVDHLFLLASDLEGAAAAWRRLGFTLSPRGTHSVEKGTANYTIIFGNDYFELLGIIADTPANQHQRDMIARDGQGLRAIACRIDDARAARAALADLGIATGEVAEFSRPLPLPGGGQGEAAFAVAHFAPDEIPAGLIFMCQHKTPDMVWRPELRDHANGAAALAGIIAVTAEPEVMAARLARLFAAGYVRPAGPGAVTVATGVASAPILCLTPAAAGARFDDGVAAATPASAYAGVQFAVRDLDVTRAALDAAGTPWRVSPGGIWVAPEHAAGTIVEFIPETRADRGGA